MSVIPLGILKVSGRGLPTLLTHQNHSEIHFTPTGMAVVKTDNSLCPRGGGGNEALL